MRGKGEGLNKERVGKNEQGQRNEKKQQQEEQGIEQRGRKFKLARGD